VLRVRLPFEGMIHLGRPKNLAKVSM